MKKVAGLFALIGFLFLANAGAQQPAGQITVAQGVDPTTMDPHMQVETTTINVLTNIFDSLTFFNRDNEVEPGLAVSWEIIDDNTWEFRLREGVRYHDGSPLTADDVVFSIMRVAAPGSRSPSHSRYAFIEDVEVVDPTTVHIKTFEPYPILPAVITDLFIMKEEHEDTVSTAPIGTGPFRFVSWTRDEALTLEAFDEYWRGAPEVERVVFRPIPEASTRLAELVTGGVDIITNILPHSVPSVEASGVASVKRIQSTRYVFVGMNLEVDSPLRSREVRQALNYAVDLDGIIAGVLLGNGEPMSQPAHAVHFGFDESISPYPYDPERARELLAQAGYPDGFKIDMMTPTGRYLNDQLAAEAIAGQLGEIGVEVSLEVMEWGTYVNAVTAERTAAPLYFLGWGSVPGLDADGIYIPLLGTGQNLSYYSNPELDEVAKRARQTMDENERLRLYSEAAQITHEDAPWIFLWNQYDLYGVSDRLDWDPVSFEKIWLYDASFN